MPSSRMIHFDRALTGAAIRTPGAARLYTEDEVEKERRLAREAGAEDARRFGEQQLVEFRTEIHHLQSETFTRLASASENLSDQVRQALPAIALEIGRRLLSGFEPPPELVAKICREALDQLFPETVALELVLSERDAGIMEATRPGWINEFAGLKITADPSLKPGDCVVRSRFGVVDARADTRLAALGQSLSQA